MIARHNIIQITQETMAVLEGGQGALYIGAMAVVAAFAFGTYRADKRAANAAEAARAQTTTRHPSSPDAGMTASQSATIRSDFEMVTWGVKKPSDLPEYVRQDNQQAPGEQPDIHGEGV